MDSTGTNMCKAVEIEGVAVKATFESRVCVGGKVIFVRFCKWLFLHYKFMSVMSSQGHKILNNNL